MGDVTIVDSYPFFVWYNTSCGDWHVGKDTLEDAVRFAESCKERGFQYVVYRSVECAVGSFDVNAEVLRLLRELRDFVVGQPPFRFDSGKVVEKVEDLGRKVDFFLKIVGGGVK